MNSLHHSTVAKALLLATLILWFAPEGFAQSERSLVRDGNKAYESKQYDQAEKQYRKSLEQNKTSLPAQYNLGNALYRQDKLDEARSQYELASTRKDVGPEAKARALHNLGNSLLKQEKYQESIEAYKQSLRINPSDNDTRYNLAYAQAKLQQQQQQQQNKNDQQQNQDKQNQDQQKSKDQSKQDKQQQDQQQQQKQDDQAKQDKKPGEQQNPAKISKEDAEKILQALNNDEKKTQKKLNKKEAVRVRIDKQW